MENPKASSSFRNFPCTSKQSLRPPKSPFPSISPSYADYGSSPAIGSKGVPKPKEGYRGHQRTSSESFLIEEQPSWLDELLDEPETPVRKGGHRRSSSDSFAYFDVANASSLDRIIQDEYKLKNISSIASLGSQVFDHYKDAQHASFYQVPNSFGRKPNRAWESSTNSVGYPRGVPSARDNARFQSSGSLCVPQEADGTSSTAFDKQDQELSGSHNLEGSSDRRDSTYTKPSVSETDPKRAKQQFAQRSRVRKLQYIAELERNVQALQAKGSEVSAEIEFLDQQNLILSMENKALKQRLESLAQEQLIKYLRLKSWELGGSVEQEVLEREIARLRTLYQQQQMQPPPSSTHHRAKSRDLESQFANLGLKHKEASSGQDPVSGQLRI
ncbi:Basic-leucine zipper domain [Macleaya cordata]|uniref:Basic-leucine zipper domain n=1 Tax=Macleaya cordata TaxID=56857 RepID=A0A200Q435_MACCD|nr:Basic-leucine zipper domain [Macleaya cordata]